MPGENDTPDTDFVRLRRTCPERIEPPALRRPANALNVETGAPAARCRLKTPESWGDADPRAVRWLWSGGSPLVLGKCACPGCPRLTTGES